MLPARASRCFAAAAASALRATPAEEPSALAECVPLAVAVDPPEGLAPVDDASPPAAGVVFKPPPRRSATTGRSTATIKEIVCRFYQIGPMQLLVTKRGTENEPRNVAIYLIRNLCGVPLLTIGVEFNLKKHSSVSSVIERTQNRVKTDRQFRKRVEVLKRLSIKGQTET